MAKLGVSRSCDHFPYGPQAGIFAQAAHRAGKPEPYGVDLSRAVFVLLDLHCPGQGAVVDEGVAHGAYSPDTLEGLPSHQDAAPGSRGHPAFRIVYQREGVEFLEK